MKIESNTQNKTIQLTLSIREAQMLNALIGNSSFYDFQAKINEGRSLDIPATSKEIQDFLGLNSYRRLKNTLENDFFQTIIKVVEFVYDKQEYGISPKWRNLHVTGENDLYIEGLEDGKTFKRFLKSRILDGKIITIS